LLVIGCWRPNKSAGASAEMAEGAGELGTEDVLSDALDAMAGQLAPVGGLWLTSQEIYHSHEQLESI